MCNMMQRQRHVLGGNVDELSLFDFKTKSASLCFTLVPAVIYEYFIESLLHITYIWSIL